MEDVVFYPKKREGCKLSQQFLRDMQQGKIRAHGFALAIWAGTHTDGEFVCTYKVQQQIRKILNLSLYKMRLAMVELKRWGYFSIDATGAICILNTEHIKCEEE